MDINQLFFRHQLAAMGTGSSRSAADRSANTLLVGHYARRIHTFREAAGLPPYAWSAGHGAPDG